MVIFNGHKVEHTKRGGKKITIVTHDGFETFKVSPRKARMIEEIAYKWLKRTGTEPSAMC